MSKDNEAHLGKAVSTEEMSEWAARRFRLNLHELKEQPFLVALRIDDAINEGKLEGWEVETLNKGEIPELPQDRRNRQLLKIRKSKLKKI